MKNTWFWCIVGFTLFSFGGSLRMFMVVRVNGWSGYLKPQTGVSKSYRRLVAQNEAPLWPLPMSYLFIAFGIGLVFGSILFSK